MINKIFKAIHNGTFISKASRYIRFKTNELCINLIKKHYSLLPLNRKKIIFDNFGGKGFADHPRYIAEELYKRKLNWKIIWLVSDMNEPLPKWVIKVKIGSWRSYYEVATAKIWVDNIRFFHLLPKKSNQVYLQTWHGSSIFKYKLIEGEDEEHLHSDYILSAKQDGKIADGILSQCNKQSLIYANYFWLNPQCEILEYGGPREDCLFDNSYVKRRSSFWRRKLGISDSDYVILYAPTFRDDGNTSVYDLNFQIILDTFKKITGKKCIIAIRLHPNVPEISTSIKYNNICIDTKSIKDSTDAIIFSDAIISDFSGIVYEACLLKKPVFCCALDLESYPNLRILDPDSANYPFIMTSSEEALSKELLALNLTQYQNKIDSYLQEHVTFDDGHASERTVNWLLDKSLQR